MRRRGSHSANMLQPSVAVVQGEQQQQQQQQQHPHHPNHPQRPVYSRTRRSLPNIREGIINGGFGDQHLPHQHQGSAAQAQNTQSFPAQPQTQSSTMGWHDQQQPTLGKQASPRHHSFASSMDLISSSRASATSTFQPFQSNLFNSSSHHTSHTAAAGDLLTMSRRALDPPLPSQNSVAKKRSASAADTGGNTAGQFNFGNMNQGSSTGGGGGHHFTHNSNSQQPATVAPQHMVSMDQGGGAFTNPQARSNFASQASINYVSSSTIGTVGDMDETYQEHRTIRRCQRSDSFEMMEDD